MSYSFRSLSFMQASRSSRMSRLLVSTFLHISFDICLQLVTMEMDLIFFHPDPSLPGMQYTFRCPQATVSNFINWTSVCFDNLHLSLTSSSVSSRVCRQASRDCIKMVDHYNTCRPQDREKIVQGHCRSLLSIMRHSRRCQGWRSRTSSENDTSWWSESRQSRWGSTQRDWLLWVPW